MVLKVMAKAKQLHYSAGGLPQQTDDEKKVGKL
jgi:hypothetical protein